MKITRAVILSLLCFFLLSQASFSAKLLMKPYLQAMDENSIYVMVETDSKETVYINYGANNKLNRRDSTYFYKETNAMKTTYIHRVKMSDLTPGTEYFYTVTKPFTIADTFHFTTVAADKPLKFVASGDSRSNPKVLGQCATAIAKEEPQFVILTGDLAYRPTYDYWKKEFFIPEILDIYSDVPFYNAVGNHEDWSENTMAFLQAPKSLSAEQGYYNVQLGDAEFFIINTEMSVSESSPQWKFIENALKQSKAKWKIAVSHIPAYCGGGHGESGAMKTMTSKLFEKYGIDLVLNGHSHFFQHNVVNGISHIITAGAGAPLYNPENKNYTLKSIKTYHYVVFDENGNDLNMNVKDLQGKIIYSYKFKKIGK